MTKQAKRILFMGTPDFAVPALNALIAEKEEIVGVVTQPDRPKGRGRKLTAPPVKKAALAAKLPVLQPANIRTDEFIEQIRALVPDLIIVVAYGRILPGALLETPPFGAINVHASLLPKYRGAAPIQWALINGEAETGITIMQMDSGLDTGDILLAAKMEIDPVDTAGTMTSKLAAQGQGLLIEALKLLRAGRLVPCKQEDFDASLAPPLCKKEGRIDWTKSAFTISCLIRGLDPWPSAFTTLAGKRIKLFSPVVVEHARTAPPGSICRADRDGLLVAAGKDYLLIREIQMEGGKRMPVDLFLRGHSVPRDERFT